MSLEDRLTIRIPTKDLKGCHNCKWHERDKHRCLDGDPYDCGWENDGTYDEW